jgi:hypothetical protein
MRKEMTIMTYEKPLLILPGSAETIILGTKDLDEKDNDLLTTSAYEVEE